METLDATSELIVLSDTLNIDISIFAGNKAKMLPPAVGRKFYAADQPIVPYYVFGPANEQGYLDALIRAAVTKVDIVSLIGFLSLKEVPDVIRRMTAISLPIPATFILQIRYMYR